MAVIPTQEGYIAHKKIIADFLTELNSKSANFVLKGGTSLMMCYGLDRFSEDIDLDAIDLAKDIIPIIQAFCKRFGYSCRVAKNTKTVKRCIVHYSLGSVDATLKIETSYRGADTDITVINGIRVYTIDSLFNLKLNALLGRDTLRDIYDVLFIYSNYAKVLTKGSIINLRRCLIAKSSDAIIEVLATQTDPLIDTRVLENAYISVCEALGVQI